MNLSFLPGELKLEKLQDGSYVITVRGEEVFSTRMEKKAITEFNKIRREMEAMFPPTELTREEKTKLLLQYIGDRRVGLDHNSFRPEEKKKKSGSTRTFG
jgi:hypothetical protein